MKIAILGNTRLGYSWFVLTHIQGLKLNGHEVIEIDYRTTPLMEIYKQMKSRKPRYCFTHISFHHIHPIPTILDLYRKITREVGTKFIHVMMDARHEPRYGKDLSNVFHMAFVAQTHNLAKFENIWKIPVIFSPYCAMSQDRMANIAADLTYPHLVFTGSPNSHPARRDFLNGVQQIMPLTIFQTQSANDLRHRTAELAVSAKAILSACIGHDITHYNEVRPWQYLGAGACLIHKKFAGEDDLIPDNMYLEYKSPADVKAQFNRVCTEDMMPMRKKAFEFMQKCHSAQVRMHNVVECMEERQYTTNSFLWECE